MWHYIRFLRFSFLRFSFLHFRFRFCIFVFGISRFRISDFLVLENQIRDAFSFFGISLFRISDFPVLENRKIEYQKFSDFVFFHFVFSLIFQPGLSDIPFSFLRFSFFHFRFRFFISRFRISDFRFLVFLDFVFPTQALAILLHVSGEQSKNLFISRSVSDFLLSVLFSFKLDILYFLISISDLGEISKSPRLLRDLGFRCI